MILGIFTYTNDSKIYSNCELFLSSKVVAKKRMVTFATHFISRRILVQFTIEEKVPIKPRINYFNRIQLKYFLRRWILKAK